MTGPARRARCDVLVIGGGVCGLWTLHTLLAAGYDAWLLEKSALGDGQTIASQGILHAGAKYNLPGNAVDASRAVADVQPTWQKALAGGDNETVPDLSAVRVLDRRMLMWTRPTLKSRSAEMGARVLMRSRVRRLSRDEWPAGFSSAPKGVTVSEAQEPVLEPASLLAELCAGVRGRARLGSVVSIQPSSADGVFIELSNGLGVRTSAVVLSAGEGNGGLLALAGQTEKTLMQRRPLHQLVAIGAPFDLNGHCMKLDMDKPEVTITTGQLHGRRTWYLGGGPAEDGVGRTTEEQITAGRAVLRRCLPWVDGSELEWRALRIDRAEGQNGGKRPNDPTVAWAAGGVVVVWPTKLVLAPEAARMVLESLRGRGIAARGAKDSTVLESLHTPKVAERVW